MRKRGKAFLFVGVMAVALALTGNEKIRDEKNTVTRYVVSIPEGKLPWPHHRPDMTQAEYDDLINNLYIINNFGQYAATADASEVYFHDGLDISLPNGTKLYAVESGYVKTVRTSNTGYGVIVIGDTEGDLPGVGWMYVHTGNFQFRTGDYVKKGDFLAVVAFAGTQHVHFGRIYVDSGPWEDSDNWNPLHPDRYFVYNDQEPPTITTPFHYFKNNTDIMIKDSGFPLVISGDVDIVVPMRDGGEFAHSKPAGYGDQLCVTRIEYEISGSSAVPVYKKSFDFTKMILPWSGPLARDRVFVVYKHYMLFNSQTPSVYADKLPEYYIITNTPGTTPPDDPKFIDCSDGDFAWNTAEKDERGNPRFPDGVYIITVTAYDFIGNHSSVSDTVQVRNKGKKTYISR